MRPSELDVDQWRRVDEVLDGALDRPSDQWGTFLDKACAGDDSLRPEVEALLEAYQRGSSALEPPVRLLGAALRIQDDDRFQDREVGPFRIVREIGRGGMGVVYLAEDTRVGRYVALKVLPPYLGVGLKARRRFEAEARAVSALDHPNIATLYETDQTGDGQLYMAFAYYDGETLDRKIQRGPLPADQAIKIAMSIARGLAAAHESGIVHRDVKPSNVLLTVSGDVKLLDFGVAKGTGDDLTGEGVRPGTVAYMSPEQITGNSIDGRADLWSLGVVLYEMLTGERPFSGASPGPLLHAIVHDKPPPVVGVGDGPTDVPERLHQVVRTLLSKSPEDRYRTAHEVLVDLQALQKGQAPSGGIRGSPRETSAKLGRGVPVERWLSTRGRKVGAVGLVLGVAAASWLAWEVSLRIEVADDVAGPDADGIGAPAAVESIAVLPLENLTGDPSQQPFVDGVHDALVAELGTVDGLRVLSRTSVLRYRGSDRSIPEIAMELGVDAILEGSVARDGDSLRVTTQLISASPEQQLWAGSWRRGVGRVFGVAGEAVRGVAEELDLGRTPSAGARPTEARAVDPAAYEAYTLGRFSLEQRSRAGFGQAENYLRRAIEIDPGFAPAYVALAQGYGSAAFFGLRRPAETLPRVEALVDSALQIDSTLAEAHGIRALVELYWHWDWDAAERSARRAIELNPSLAAAHRTLSEVHAVRGRLGHALASVRRGSELERFIPFAQIRPVVVLNFMDDFDAAVLEARAAIDFFPDVWQGHWLLCQALAGRGDFQGAAKACERAVNASERTPMALGALGYAYAGQGRRDAAEQIADELEARAELGYVGGSYVAMVHGALGDLDRAFEWLDRAYEERELTLVSLPHDPFFDPLRSDPRFVDLWARMGLEGRPAQARTRG